MVLVLDLFGLLIVLATFWVGALLFSLFIPLLFGGLVLGGGGSLRMSSLHLFFSSIVFSLALMLVSIFRSISLCFSITSLFLENISQSSKL